MFWPIFIAIILFATLFFINKKTKKKQPIYPEYKSKAAELSTKEKKMLVLINEYRKSFGVAAVKADEYATFLARKHSLHWFERNVKMTGHHEFAPRRAKLINLGADKVVEITNQGYMESVGSIKGFSESMSHEWKLRGDFTHVGIGIVDRNYTVIFIKIE